MTLDKNDIVKIAQEVERRVRQEAEQFPAEADKKSATPDDPSLQFIGQCYRSNEVGDAVLFNYFNRGKFVYNVVRNRWLTYLGPHWDMDLTNRSLAAIEDTVVPQYLRMIEEIDKDMANDPENTALVKVLAKRKTAILKRLDRLRSVAGRKNCLICAHSGADPLTVHEDDLDQHPWLLACPNTVIDLRTGEDRPGRPDDWLTKCTKTEWHGLQKKCPQFTAYLLDCLGGEQEVFDFLIRVLGYAITGLDIERIFIVLLGEHGQSGKSTLMEILYEIMGVLAGPIQAEMLMSQRGVKSSSAPSPDILALKGKRVIWASETEEDHRFATGKIKWMTGGDPLKGRGINDKDETDFRTTHTLFLLSNRMPGAPAHDSAFWKRTYIVNFPNSYIDDPDPAKHHEKKKTKGLAQKLIDEEGPGIMALLVQGCIDYQRRGLDPPAPVLDLTKSKRRTEDVLADFIEECCEIGTGKDFNESAKDLYNRYTTWWETESSKRPMSKKKFGQLLKLKFEDIKTGGFIKYYGLQLQAFTAGEN